MKRSRNDVSQELGALEFASILNNGEDARAILSTLGRFSKTIRRQRRQALLPHDYNEEEYSSDDSSSEDDDENDDTITRKRPRKQEDWMEDTASFNVPFVGTSVAKGETGTVVEGEWPTGFLEVYLKASPMAVELTSGELIPPSGHVHKRLLSKKSKHGKRASQAIYRAYLEALAELITAHVPISSLQRDYGVQPREEHEYLSPSLSRDSFVSLILKDLLAGFMTLLNQETGGGKQMDRPLVAVVLKVLANLSATSLGAAREITRALDASLKDGILKSLLKSRKNSHRDKEQDDDEGELKEYEDDCVRIECLRLAALLTEWQDAAITSFITTKGSRERKINAGILYLSLKLGLHDFTFEHNSQDDGDSDDGYVSVVTRLLRAVERLLPESNRGPRRPLMSTRDLVDLFSGDAFVHISQIASCAPPLTDSESFRNVLAEKMMESPTALEAAGSQGRRILFCFLANPERSPFLSRINNEKADEKSVDHCIQQLVRAMMLLLQRNSSTPVQRFLIHCLQTTTALVQNFFKSVMVPDPTRQVFPFIARMGFLFRLVREVPPVSECIVGGGTLDEQTVDCIVACIVPANLKKHVMSKALQSTNALIVSEILKLLCALMDRYRTFVDDGSWGKDGDDVRELLAEAFIRRLPDMQPLLSVRSRFDPFSSEGDVKASPVVTGLVCKVLDSYARHLPQVLDSVKFDWTKLLPSDAKSFCLTIPVLQFQLLQTLENVLAVHEHHLSTAAIRIVFEIMIATSHEAVYKKARSVAFGMIALPTLKSSDAETRKCIEYEMSLLIDGLTQENIVELCSLLKSSGNNRFQHGMAIADAWNRAGFDEAMPPICFSPVLTTFISVMGIASELFSLFACQVLIKCLLFQRYPLPLASLVATKLADSDSDAPHVNLLCKYSQGLIRADDVDSAVGCVPLLASVLGELFAPSCLQNVLMTSLMDASSNLNISAISRLTGCDIEAAIRQCLHVSTIASNTSDGKQSIMNLRTLIPLVGQRDDSFPMNSYFNTILEHPLVTTGQYPWHELAYLKAVALCSQSDAGATSPLETVSIDGLGPVNSQAADEDSSTHLKNTLLHTLLVPLLPKNLSISTMGGVLSRLCESARDQDQRAFSSVASLTLYWMKKQRDEISSFVPLMAALEAWRIVVETSDANEVTQRLARCLESLLSSALVAQNSENASLLYSFFLKSPATETVHVCIRSKEMALSVEADTAADHQYPSLLSSLTYSDPMLFGLSFLAYLGRSIEESPTRRLLEKGLIDEEIAVLSRCRDLLTTETFEKVQDAIVKRSLEALSVEPELLCRSTSGSTKDGLAALLCIPGVLQARHVESFTEIALKSLRNQSKRISFDDTWYQISSTLLCRARDEIFGSQAELSSTVLVCAFQALSSSLKSYFKPSKSSSQGDASSTACLEVLGQVLDLVKKGMLHDITKLSGEGSTAAMGAIKASLKYGLTHATDEDNDIPARCFQFVRTLLVESWESSSSLHALKSHCILLDPSTILALILSHSHFRESLVSTIADGQPCTTEASAKLELVRLLLVCTSLSDETVFKSDVWATLLAAYNAGTTEVDITLRRLFVVCADSLSKSVENFKLPYAEAMKWKGIAPTSEEEMKTSGWDWLANGVDTSRIRATLTQFPVHDRMKADPIQDVEVWLEGIGDKEVVYNGSNDLEDTPMESDSSSSDGSDTSMEDVSDVASDLGRTRHAIDFDAWIGTGSDTRYSPAFILPLVLAALENSIANSDLRTSSDHHGTSMQYDRDVENKDEVESASVKEFVLLAQRLCEKGCLSLALASLCSECSSLRKVAVATLSHIKKALDTREARKLTTWRERPQLAMILDSVQRGLAVRIALRIDPHEVPSSIPIPKLPALSAVFLAHAAFIIVKPGDSMFGPMNRYFLRLDNGHGAFQDTNRIPAFISLFCSSAEDLGQARRERLWALQLLKDSFVEEYCYRFVEKCHAPELLLTSFQNMSSSQENGQYETDGILLLDTLTALLQNGGRRAASHLIERLGLLSWIRGQLVTGELLHLLSSLEGRIAFLRLIRTSLTIARQYLDGDGEVSGKHHLLMESKALVSCIGRLYDASIDGGLITPSNQKDSLNSEMFAALTSEVLGILVRMTDELGSSENLVESEASGIPLSVALRILQTTSPDLREAMTFSVCKVPLNIDAEVSECVGMFSQLALSVLSTYDVEADTRKAVLNRVTRLVLPEKLMDDDVLGALLACRPQCLRSCREAWFKCLQAVIDNSASTESKLFRTGKDILDADLVIASDMTESG